MKPKNYSPAADGLRVIAILAVVLIHTTARALEATNLDVQRLPGTLLLNQVARFAVPMFFMISGFVLELSYPNHPNYLTYIKKRLGKIAIPYMAWSAVYFLLVYTQHSSNYLQALLFGSASYQLYFIPTLVIFYAVFPVIHLLKPILTNKWVMVILGCVQVWLLYMVYFVRPLPFVYPVSIALLNYYVFIIGIAAVGAQEKILKVVEKYRGLFAAAAIVLAGVVFWEGYSGYVSTHDYQKFYTQWRPSILVYTTVLAGGLMLVFNKLKTKVGWIAKWSGLSFFVFFVHVIVLENVWRVWGRLVFAGQWWFDIVFFGLVAGISFGAAYIAHKIPQVAKLTG